MNKIRSLIMRTDFKKFFIRFFAVSLAVIVIGGALTGFCFRKQISEGIAYERMMERDYGRIPAGTGTADTGTADNGKADGQNADNGNGAADGGQYNGQYGDRHDGQYGHDDDLIDDWFDHAPITEPSTGAKIEAGIFAGLCVLIFVFYWLAVAAWLYKAAALAKMNKTLWTVAGLAGDLAAVVLFLIVRSIIREKCAECGSWQKKGGEYCSGCGERLKVKCPGCGAECKKGEKYCPVCGVSLREDEEDDE